MANRYVSSTQYNNVAQWTASHTYAAGSIVRQLATPAVGSERCFRTVSGGVSGSTEPSWDLSQGATQPADNTVTWVEITGQEAYQGSGSGTWLAPYARLESAFAFYMATVSIGNGGASGYGVGNVLSSNTGTLYGSAASVTVTSVSSGVVTGISKKSGGSFSATPTTTNGATTGGANNGFLLSCTVSQNCAAGDTIFVGNDHAETQSSGFTINSPGTAALPVNVLCANVSGSVPPTDSNLVTTPTASISTTGASNLVVNGYTFYQGIAFNAGSGASTASLTLGGSGLAAPILNGCSLNLVGTSSSSAIAFGGSGVFGYGGRLRNTTVSFGNTSQGINVNQGAWLWENTVSAIQGATLPLTLFSPSYGYLTCRGVDFSALGSGKRLVSMSNIVGSILFVDCRLGVAVSVTVNTQGNYQMSGYAVSVQNCDDSSGSRNYRCELYSYGSNHVQETTVVRTGGASNGTTAESWKITTGASTSFNFPFECLPIGRAFPNVASSEAVGTAVTTTVAGIYNGASMLTNAQIWLEIETLTSSGYPLSTFSSTAPTSVIATPSNLTADSTSAWDSVAGARANSTPYTTSSVIKLASNPGRLFFCTTAGTSAGSEPAGYASAVDGGSVTDGGAVFRAGWRFSLSVTTTPQMVGAIIGRVKVGGASLSGLYIDPRPQPA